MNAALVGRAAIVTGASRGIGAACARALDAAGARVALVARDAAALAAVAAGLAHDPVVLPVDLTATEAPAEVARAAVDALGRVDVLVNNAAVAARLDSLELDGATVDRLYHLNVRQLLLLTTALLPELIASGHGAVVNVSSISGLVGTPRRAAYAATKGAVDALTRSLAMEFGPRGVRVNAVAPGCVVTDLWARNREVPGVVERIEEQTALRRWGEPEDVADVVAFLASDAARFVTGTTIPVDGGMATTMDLYGGAV